MIDLIEFVFGLLEILLEILVKGAWLVPWTFRSTEGWSWAFFLPIAAAPAYLSYDLWIAHYLAAAKIFAGVATAMLVVKLVLFLWLRARQPTRSS